MNDFYDPVNFSESKKKKHTARSVKSDSWTNDSRKLVLFSESKTYSTTSIVWLVNKWLLGVGSF